MRPACSSGQPGKPLNETLLRRALTELMAEHTMVVIAHRLYTVRDADTIVVLDDDRIVKTSTPPDLLARAGLYAQLFTRQLAAASGVRWNEVNHSKFVKKKDKENMRHGYQRRSCLLGLRRFEC